MHKWIITAFTALALASSSYAFWQQDHAPGQRPAVTETYSAHELERQQGQVKTSAPVGSIPVRTERNDTQSIGSDTTAAPNLTDGAKPSEGSGADGSQALAAVEQDIQTQKGKTWWHLPLLGALFLGIGAGGFYGFTRWGEKLASTPLQPVTPLPARSRRTRRRTEIS